MTILSAIKVAGDFEDLAKSGFPKYHSHKTSSCSANFGHLIQLHTGNFGHLSSESKHQNHGWWKKLVYPIIYMVFEAGFQPSRVVITYTNNSKRSLPTRIEQRQALASPKKRVIYHSKTTLNTKVCTSVYCKFLRVCRLTTPPQKNGSFVWDDSIFTI